MTQYLKKKVPNFNLPIPAQINHYPESGVTALCFVFFLSLNLILFFTYLLYILLTAPLPVTPSHNPSFPSTLRGMGGLDISPTLTLQVSMIWALPL